MLWCLVVVLSCVVSFWPSESRGQDFFVGNLVEDCPSIYKNYHARERFREKVLEGTEHNPLPVGILHEILTEADKQMKQVDDKNEHKLALYNLILKRKTLPKSMEEQLAERLRQRSADYGQMVKTVLSSLPKTKRSDVALEIKMIADLRRQSKTRNEPLLKDFYDRVPLDKLKVIQKELHQVQSEN